MDFLSGILVGLGIVVGLFLWSWGMEVFFRSDFAKPPTAEELREWEAARQRKKAAKQHKHEWGPEYYLSRGEKVRNCTDPGCRAKKWGWIIIK